MGLFSGLLAWAGVREAFSSPPVAGFPVTDIPVADVEPGMTLVGAPGSTVWPDDNGDWPVITSGPEYGEHRGKPYVYFEADDGGGYWCSPDDVVRVAADAGWDGEPEW